MNPYQIFKYVPLSILQIVARFVAWILIKIPTASLIRTIKTNMTLVNPTLSDTQQQTIIKDIVRHQCLSSVESVKSWAMHPVWSIEQIRQVHHQDILLKGLANPNGMLAIVPHLGTWEIMNAWLNQFGSPTIMYKPVKGNLTNDFVLKGRQRLNATLVPTDASGVKAVFKTLKQGGFSIVLPDHVPEPSGGVIVPFFGVDTLTSTLASKLASKTKCALVGISCIRRENGDGFDIYCYDLDDPRLYERNASLSARALNQAMEQMIKQHYTHYMWGYRRFKHIPSIDNPYNIDNATLTEFAHRNYHQTLQTQQNNDTNS